VLKSKHFYAPPLKGERKSHWIGTLSTEDRGAVSPKWEPHHCRVTGLERPEEFGSLLVPICVPEGPDEVPLRIEF
jgi:hypothetical protein